MKVIDRHTGKELSDQEILEEANRDHSDEWVDYTTEDMQTMPEDVIQWIDTKYFEVVL